jgi:hypothetical protein
VLPEQVVPVVVVEPHAQVVPEHQRPLEGDVITLRLPVTGIPVLPEAQEVLEERVHRVPLRQAATDTFIQALKEGVEVLEDKVAEEAVVVVAVVKESISPATLMVAVAVVVVVVEVLEAQEAPEEKEGDLP